MRRVGLAVVVGFTIALLAAAEAQEAAKVWRIGLLLGYSPDLDKPLLTAFRDGLRELGYLEGRNVIIEQRYAGGARPERFVGLVEELARSKVDVFVVHGFPQAVRAAEQASTATPVVFVANPDPIGSGLAASLARPGGRSTGVSDSHGELAAKRLSLLKEAFPSLSRVAVLHTASGTNLSQLKDTQAAASRLRLTVVPVETRGGPSPTDIDRALTTIRREGADALNVLSGAAGVHYSRVADFALSHQMPTITTGRAATEHGFLMSYGADHRALYHRAATYVDKILKGAKPADLPVDRQLELRRLLNGEVGGLTIPQTLLFQATQVIE